MPNRASRNGWRGRRIGRRMSRKSASPRSRKGRSSRSYAGPSSPSSRAVSSRLRRSSAGSSSSRGCASAISGSSHCTPQRSRASSRQKGESAPIGWMPEQRSWTKPGSMSSADRAPPPISSAASSTRTEMPARASSIAALSPFGPAPTTMASGTAGRAALQPSCGCATSCQTRTWRVSRSRSEPTANGTTEVTIGW